MDLHQLEMVGLVAYISAKRTHITKKKEIFDGTHIAKKGNFDGPTL